MDAVVCGTCGSGSRPHLIVNCAGCNASEHLYCMKVLTYVIPNEWYCAGCQEYANVCPNPSQGGQTELQNPWHGCDKMKEREIANMHLSHNNVAHQINPRSSNKFGNAKVKFISSEEVALLNGGRPPYVRSRFAVCPRKGHPSSPPNTKHSINLKCISPSRSDTQVQALKRCAAACHDQIKIEDRSYFAKCQRKIHPAYRSSVKQPFNMKSISPSRSDMQVQALKQCAAASHDPAKIEGRPDFAMRQSQVHPVSPPHVTSSASGCAAASHDQTKIEDRSYFAKCQRKIHPASPPSVKQPSNMKSISPSTSDMQVPTLKQCASASRDPAKIEGRSDFAMRQSQVHPASPPHVTSSTSGSDAGSKSEAESLNQNIGVVLSIDPSMEYTRRPPPAICWMGCFHVSDVGINLGRFKAQFPSKVSSKVYDIVKMIPSNLELELLPRMNDWPKSFEARCPVYEDIGLFFFPNEPDGHEKKHSYLFEESNNFVLRAYINGIKLLIYSSEVLPHDSQWIDGEFYLWGVFVRLERKSVPRQFSSTTT